MSRKHKILTQLASGRQWLAAPHPQPPQGLSHPAQEGPSAAAAGQMAAFPAADQACAEQQVEGSDRALLFF